MESKIRVKDFVTAAIVKLRKPGHNGIHVVYSGFNEAFREYYGEEPQPHIQELVEDGYLTLQVCKGGAILRLASESTNVRSQALGKILGE